MRRRGSALVGAALLSALAAGCGGGGSTDPSGASGSAGSSSPAAAPPSAPHSPDDDGATADPGGALSGGPEPVPTEREELADLAEQAASSAAAADTPLLGADISWPQCPKGLGIPQKRTLGLPLPGPDARYVVIGLTNGPGFYPNPCLADQVELARSRGLRAAAYAVASFPDAATLARHGERGPFDSGSDLDALRNTGFAQAGFNVASMRAAGLRTPIVWIDVEPVPDFDWSSDRRANAAVVQGLARGYTDAGYRIGVYSTPYLWSGVVGDLSLAVPEWRAAGQTSQAEALARCGPEWVIQGGPAVLGQWVADRQDLNVTCPGVSAQLGRWFHQY